MTPFEPRPLGHQREHNTPIGDTEGDDAPVGSAPEDSGPEQSLPTMHQLNELSADLDDVDAVLVRMDAQNPVQASDT